MKPNGKGYSPMGVLGMLKEKGVNVPVGPRVPVKPLLDAAGDVVKIPETCPILLLAFTKGAQIIPDDFFGLEKSGQALRNYVRPDGGVYLGAFQAAGESEGVVVVFGDPAMSLEQAQRIAMQYRGQLMERYDAEVALGHLGPFAAGTVSEVSPALPHPEWDAPT